MGRIVGFLLLLNAMSLSLSAEEGDPILAFNGEKIIDIAHCQDLQVRISPFFVLNQKLANIKTELAQGSIVDFNKRIIFTQPQENQRILLNDSLYNSYLDDLKSWSFQIQIKDSFKNTDLQQIENKTLKAVYSEGAYKIKRCCNGPRCQVYPLFQTVAEEPELFAFHFRNAQFIKSYRAQKKSSQNTLKNTKVQKNSSSSMVAVQTTSITLPAEANTPALTTSQQVVCTESSPLRIFDDALKNVVYRIQRFQAIKVFQNWDGSANQRTLDNMTLIRVQAHNAKGVMINGWANKQYIKPASQCKGFPLVGSEKGETLIEDSTIVVNTRQKFRFPTLFKPLYDYVKGAGKRYFGASRGGRLHAACDLFRPDGEKVLAIEGGKILRKYHFFSGTYAIEVKHDSGPVVRYGEVRSTNVTHSGTGDRVAKGQHIGYIAHLRMLHFEMYKDTVSGPLTQRRGGAYQRRADLIDPTQKLKSWEIATF